jgi:2-oxoglutarate ferredoxin oxidoreductase subunit delta
VVNPDSPEWFQLQKSTVGKALSETFGTSKTFLNGLLLSKLELIFCPDSRESEISNLAIEKKKSSVLMKKEAPTIEKKKTPPKVSIKESWCKGCEICVAFCPTGVLEMRDKVAVVVKEEACIACMLCELRCPDFAITVLVEEEGETR